MVGGATATDEQPGTADRRPDATQSEQRRDDFHDGEPPGDRRHTAPPGASCRGSGARSITPEVMAGTPEVMAYWDFMFGFQRASVAPVGSVMTLIQPKDPTWVTSTHTLAPSSLAFFVAASISPTPT